MGKIYLRIITAILLITSLSTITKGQATASASATAVILPYAGTEKLNDLVFGTFTNSSNASLTLDPAGLTKTVGSVQAFNNSTGQLATFSIMGADYAYDIMLPSKPIIISSKANEGVMEVSNFTITPSQNIYQQGANKTYSIGATLTVQPCISAGSYYTPTPITVIINFN